MVVLVGDSAYVRQQSILCARISAPKIESTFFGGESTKDPSPEKTAVVPRQFVWSRSSLPPEVGRLSPPADGAGDFNTGVTVGFVR
jgi:hypothetical protein